MYRPIDEQSRRPWWSGLAWICTPDDLAAWAAPERPPSFLRYTFELPVEPRRAWIQVWSDWGYELWVNGASAYQAPRGLMWTHRDEVEHLLRPGANHLALAVYGGTWRTGGTLVAGEVELADGRVVLIRSDTSWQYHPSPPDDWYQPETDRTGWRPVRDVVAAARAGDLPNPPNVRRRIDSAPFDPDAFDREVARFYGIDDAATLQIPGERYVAFQGGGYWAPLEKLSDGSIGAVVRGGGCHSGREGRLLFIRSRDGGRTWTSPVVVADSPWCDYGCGLGALPDGTLIVGYRKTRNYDGRGNVLWRDTQLHVETLVVESPDNGETWGTPRVLSPIGLPSSLPYGKMIAFPDDRIWMAEYRANTPCYRVSSNRGTTWSDLRPLPAPGCDETALCRLKDGRIVVALRGAIDQGEACWVIRSDDEGQTWSAPVQVTERAEIPPDLIELQSGRLLLTFGRRTFPEGVQVMLSDDRGATWYRPSRFILTSDAMHDHGYPSSVQLADETIVTIYYATGNRFYPEIGNHTGVVRWREPS